VGRGRGGPLTPDGPSLRGTAGKGGYKMNNNAIIKITYDDSFTETHCEYLWNGAANPGSATDLAARGVHLVTEAELGEDCWVGDVSMAKPRSWNHADSAVGDALAAWWRQVPPQLRHPDMYLGPAGEEVMTAAERHAQRSAAGVARLTELEEWQYNNSIGAAIDSHHHFFSD